MSATTVEPGYGSKPRARLLAFHLPQFHPTPENDRWWGKGFTEWTNVTRAQPLFPGHYQPHLPANLGFYDLRLPEARAAHAALAGRYSIEGFCYWHYWFAGTRLLHEPVDAILASGEPDFPFCLAWANETWSRRWLGEERDILLKQTYPAEDDVAHARWLLPALADRRAVRVHGRPLFLVYRPADLPSPGRTTDVLREQSVRAGLPEPFLVGVDAHRRLDARTLGFDSTLAFEPQLGALGGVRDEGLDVHDYVEARRLMRRNEAYPLIKSIVVSWDNTPRRGREGTVLANSSPEAFGDGLRELIDEVAGRPFDERLVFVNAWNEWGEGNHLEPDRRHGLGYLEAVRAANASHVLAAAR